MIPIALLLTIPFSIFGKFVFGLGIHFSIIIFSIALLFGLFVGFSTRWVEIEHQSPTGDTERSYFADGFNLGWRGIFGGTKRLYGKLNKFHNESA